MSECLSRIQGTRVEHGTMGWQIMMLFCLQHRNQSLVNKLLLCYFVCMGIGQEVERIIPPLLAISLSTSRPLLLFSGVVESFMYLIILAMEDKGRQIIKSQGSFSPQVEYYFKDHFFL